jgi:hypothetical protein
MAKITFALIVLVIVVQVSPARADWDVRRGGGGSCSLQPSDSRPLLGQLLSRKPTDKEACEDAKQLKSDDVADSKKCFDYTPNSVSFCRNRGVELPN